MPRAKATTASDGATTTRRPRQKLTDAEREAQRVAKEARRLERERKKAERDAQREIKRAERSAKWLNSHRRVRITMITDEQIEEAAQRVLKGEPLSTISRQLNVNALRLAEKIKDYVKKYHLQEWQQSVQYDCLRAEMLLNAAMDGALVQGDSRWAALAVKVLEYRAKVLGFGQEQPQEDTQRVAGLSREDIFDRIIAKL